MFREGGYNPESAKLQHEQKKAAEKDTERLQEAEGQRLQGEVNKQVEQFADEAMSKLLEVPAIAERSKEDPSFKMEIDELKEHLMKADSLDKAQQIVDSFSPEVGAVMADFIPTVVGQEFMPTGEAQPFEDQEKAA